MAKTTPIDAARDERRHTANLQRAKALQVKTARAIRSDPVVAALSRELAAARATIAELQEQNRQYHDALHEKAESKPKSAAKASGK